VFELEDKKNISYTLSEKVNELSYHWSIRFIEATPETIKEKMKDERFKDYKTYIDLTIYAKKLFRLPNQTNEDKPIPHKIMEGYLTDFIIEYIDDTTEKLKEEGIIEVAALAYMRGWNVDNTILVFEEAQNATPSQIKLLITRIGYNSKFFISGDLEQSDKFRDKTKSGLYDAKVRLSDVKNIGLFEFTDPKDIVRNPLISEILKKYD
jgi:hypothetical protein